MTGNPISLRPYLPPSPIQALALLYQLCVTDNYVCPGLADNPGGHNRLQMTDPFPFLQYMNMWIVNSYYMVFVNRLCLQVPQGHC